MSERRHPAILYSAMLEEIRANRYLTSAERDVALTLVEAVGSGRIGLSGLDTMVTYAFDRLREAGFVSGKNEADAIAERPTSGRWPYDYKP